MLLGGIGAVVVAAAVVAAILLGTGTVPSAISRVPAAPDATTAPGSSSGTGDGSGAGASTSGTDTQRAQQQAVIDYYALLPGRLDEGWVRLTPRYQQTTADGFGGYRGFWSAIERVTVQGVSPSSSGDGVDATVSYTYRDGRAVTERTVFAMVQADGFWKIDGSTVVSRR